MKTATQIRSSYVADRLLLAYLNERAAREGIPRPHLFHEVSVSSCCGDSTTLTRRGTLRCLKCGQGCDRAKLEVPRDMQRRSRKPTIRVRPQHFVRNDAAERMHASAHRMLLLRRLVEATPRGLSPRRWAFALTPSERWGLQLLAWEGYLHAKLNQHQVRAMGEKLYPLPGLWTEHGFRDAVFEAREVVERRAMRRPLQVNRLLGG